MKKARCLEALRDLEAKIKEIEKHINKDEYYSALTESRYSLPELVDDLINEILGDKE